MLTLQQMLDIACRYATAMADAMVAACLGRAVETGERLLMPRGHPTPTGRVGTRPAESIEWERMVRGNSDTRRCHV